MTLLDPEDEQVCDCCYNLVRQWSLDDGDIRAYCYRNLKPDKGECREWTKGMK